MCLGCLPQDVIGNPDPEHIRNSYWDIPARTYGRGGAQPFITAAEKSLIADEAEIVRDDAKATYDAMLADFTKQQKAGAIK